MMTKFLDPCEVGRETGRPRRTRVARSAASGRAAARLLGLLALALLGSACGDYGGSSSGADAVAGAFVAGASAASEADHVAAFSQTVFPIVRQNCDTCHAGSGPGTPHIAHGDAGSAYRAVVDNQKVSLGSPGSSRLVRRLVADFHYCWSDCTQNGMEMQAAIQAWADLVNFGAGGTDVDGIASEVLTLNDGAEDDGQLRYQRNLVAFYDFKEGEGSVAHDVSGLEPAMDLSLSGFEWLSGYGVQMMGGKAYALAETSRKLYDQIADPQSGTQQYSVEAWVVPDNVDQEGPARIVTYSADPGLRNFTLGQRLYTYVFRNRSISPELDENGRPSLSTADADEDLQATLQHVVISFDQYRGRRVYVNGEYTDDEDEQEAARLWNWNPDYVFALADEVTGDRPWLGHIRLVAVYKVALTEAQIRQNYTAGVGKRLLLSFDVSQWAGSGSFVEFVVSELDAYSYLFCEPTFVSPDASGFRVANLRIAVNGQTPVSGQAFVNVDTAITSSRQKLSRQCSIVPKDAGPDLDQFSVEFEVLGEFQNPIVEEPPTLPPPGGGVIEAYPLEGFRDFARINDTMAEVTGLDPTADALRAASEELTQQLPSGSDPRSFSSAQQVAIAKLALEYCNALVESSSARDAFFGVNPAFEFDAPPEIAFSDQAKRDLVIDRLVERMLGVNLANQPSRLEVAPVLDDLFDDLLATCAPGACDADRTRTVVKSACAAVLSSAAASIH